MQNLNIKKVQYILFDWDNTLADTKNCHIESINEVLKEYNLPDWNEVKKLRDTYLSLKNNFPNIFGEKANETFAKYAKIYEKKSPQMVHKFPYVDELIAFLQSKNKKLMIVSNKDRNLLEIDCKRLFPEGTFEKLVAGNEALKDKPSQEHVYYALDGYLKPQEVSPEKVWLVGDSKFDIECAVNANALPILIGGEATKEGIVHFEDFKSFINELKSSN